MTQYLCKSLDQDILFVHSCKTIKLRSERLLILQFKMINLNSYKTLTSMECKLYLKRYKALQKLSQVYLGSLVMLGSAVSLYTVYRWGGEMFLRDSGSLFMFKNKMHSI